MYCRYFILLLILVVVISIMSKHIREYIKDEYPNLIINLSISIISIFIGAFLAIETTKIINNSEEKEKYVSLLHSCIKMNENYIATTKTIIDSIRFKPDSNFEILGSLNNVNDSFILEEIIKNGYLYKFSSDNFKSYLPKIISKMQYNDLNREKNDIYKYEILYRDLILKKEMIEIELRFLKNKLTDDQMTIYYKDLLSKYLGPMEDINDSTDYRVESFIDSISVFDNIVFDGYRDSLIIYQTTK